MKLIYTFLIITIIIPLTLHGQNLIVNGGCEEPGTGTSNIPDSWVNTNTDGIKCFQEGSFDAVVSEGSYAFGKNSFDSGDYTLTQVIDLGSDEGESVFDYSIDYNTFASTTHKFSLLIEALNSADNELGELYSSGDITTSNIWQTLSGSTIEAPMGTQKLRITLTWIQVGMNDVILDNFTLIKNTSLSSTEFQNSNEIKLYPNPARKFIQISGISEKEHYTIYDVSGSKIYSGAITNHQQIDIRKFANGMYLLKFDNGKTIKFIKE